MVLASGVLVADESAIPGPGGSLVDSPPAVLLLEVGVTACGGGDVEVEVEALVGVEAVGDGVATVSGLLSAEIIK